MNALAEYIAGRGEAPSRRELNRTIDRYNWFTTARRVRALTTGEPDPALTLPLMFWPTLPPVLRESSDPEVAVSESASRLVPDAAELQPADIIDRFIEHGDYRIDPKGEAREVEVDVDIDPEMVSPELAEIYRAQGLTEEAEKIYRVLNLRNS